MLEDEYMPDTELYKKKNIARIKEYLNNILNLSMDIVYNITESYVYYDIVYHNHFSINNSKDNVINNYLKSTEYEISIINHLCIQENAIIGLKYLIVIFIIVSIIMSLEYLIG
ncbi:hypothetical protein NEPAR07_2426 [Nematocida parisii]|nr:hypothetical protein NEPAR07_2426 [Nematocida parisii]